MASETENHSQTTTITTPSSLDNSLVNDPNFAIICSFIEKFGEICHIGFISFSQLQEMLENTNDVPLPLVQLHIRLLRRVFKSINTSKWEKSVSKFAHLYNSQDGWEVERFGYKKSKVQTKLRILKNLLESQFDYNPKFKGEVNKLPASDLRTAIAGRDAQGHCYWYQFDVEANLRVYREDVEGETWEIVASTREELEQLIVQLRSGQIRKASTADDDAIEEDEDTNGLEVEILKDILLDTGKILEEEDDVDMASGGCSELSDESNSLEIAIPNDDHKESLGDDNLVNNSCQPNSALSTTLVESSNTKKKKKDRDNNIDSSDLVIAESSSSSPSPPKSKTEIKVQDENHTDCVVNTPVVPDSNFESTSLKESSTNNYEDKNISIPSSLESAVNVDIIVKSERLGDDVNNDVVKIENTTNLHAASTLADTSNKVVTGQRNTLKSQHSIIMEEPSEIKIKNKSMERNVGIKTRNTTTNELLQQADNIKSFTEPSNISGNCSVVESLQSIGTIKEEGEKKEIQIDIKPEENEQHSCRDVMKDLPSDAATISPYFLSSSNSDDNSKTFGHIPSKPIKNSISSTSPFEIHESRKGIGGSWKKDESETQQLLTPTGDIMSEQNESCFVGKPPGKKSAVLHSLTDGDGVLNSNNKLAPKSDQQQKNFKSSQKVIPSGDDHGNTVKSISAIDATTTNVSTERQEDHNIVVSPYFDKIGSDAAKIVDSLTESVKFADDLLVQQQCESLQGPPSSSSQSFDIIIPNVSSVDEQQPNNICNSAISHFSLTENLSSNVPSIPQKFNAFNIDSMLRRRSNELPEKSFESHMNLAEEKVKQLPIDVVKTSLDSQIEPVKCTAESSEHSTAKLDFMQKEEVTVNKKLTSISSQSSDVEAGGSQPENSETIIQTEKITKEPKHTQESEKVVDDNKGNKEESSTIENKTIAKEVQLESSTLGTTESSDISVPMEGNASTILTSTSPAKETVNSHSRGCSESQLQLSHSLSASSTDVVVPSVATTQPDQGVTESFCVSNNKNNADDLTTTVIDTGTTNKPASVSCSVQDIKLSEPNPSVKKEKVGSLGLVGYDCSSSEDEDNDSNKDMAKPNKNIVPISSSSIEKTGDGQHVSTLLVQEKSVEEQVLLSDVCAPVSETDKVEATNIDLLHVNSTGPVEPIPGSGGQKRKLDEEPDSTSGEQQDHPHQLKTRKISCSDNPIVGETIEEDVFFVTGTGEGALNEGGNETPSPTETLLPPPTEVLDMSEDQLNSAAETDKNTPPVKQKGRGRPRKNPPKEVLKDKNVTSSTTTPEAKKNRRNSSTDEVNGLSSSVRRSGRVAQIRQKEEEERRKLEEERLAQLKAAQLRKKQKQLERELKAAKDGGEVPIKPPKQPKAPKIPKTPKTQKAPKIPKAGKVAKAKSGAKQVTYIPPSSEDDSETEGEAEDEGEEYDGRSAKPGKKRRKKRAKNGKALKRGANPWLHSSEESEDEAVEEEEEHYEEEEEEEELVFNKSDHEFSPESDLEDTEFSPSRHARTAKQKEQAVDKYAETYCEKCAKGDHPEWILLCDSCDHGWHASCVYPQLWVIPEGEWFCPKCSQRMLVEKLSENLIEFDKLLKKRENEVLRKQRLAYVGISLNNVLPSAEKPADKSEDEENGDEKHKSRKSRRRRNYSDEEIGGFINDNDDDDNSSSGSGSSYESEDEPMYQLRARRATKGFSFQEYDEMINTALGDDSADVEEAQPATSELADEVPADSENHVNENGEEAKVKPVKVAVGGGKRMPDEDDSEEEELDEKEKNRRKMLSQSQRKSRRRLNDLDATSEEDSDEDFKGSGGDDDEEDEEEAVEDDSEWSGDESDDSIAVAKLSRKKRKHRRGPLGRQEKYLDDGETVRRSTRRRKSRIIYDESDQEEDEDDQTEKWQSGESDVSEEEEEDESDSESDDETWGKKKKQKKPAGGSKLPNFFLGGSGPSILKKPRKKKRRRVDEDDVDRAWTNKFGSKVKKLSEEPVERKTRGKQINFKDILDSGESDDDGNIRPKRRRILSDDSDDDDDEMPGSSRKLVEEIKAANAKAAAEEKLKHEEKLREMAVENKKLESENIQAKPLPIISDLPPAIPEPEKEEERPVKITNSIVESILMRKTPDIESPVTSPLPPPPSIINEEPYVPPSISGIMPGPLVGVPSYLATVLGGGGGSARVGKKKVSASMMPTPVSQSGDVLPFPSSSSKKSSGVVSIPVPPKPLPGTLASSSSPVSPLSSSSGPRSALPPNIPSELTRIAAPMYANNPALIRSFTPPWGRNPPPYTGPPNLGKPPPLNSSSFMTQPGPLRPLSSSYSPSPPPTLRIPNPNTLQAFQQFSKRSADVGGPHYRMPHQLSSVLPSMTRERIFLGGSSPYASYGMLPPQSQQHPALFAPPFDYRAAESFKEELLERHSQQLHPPMGPSTTLASAHALGQHLKDEMNHPPTQGDGEFGGLVSYFSSQHSNDED